MVPRAQPHRIILCVLRWWIGGVFFIEVVRVIIHKA
jgi:hypothetical protein